GHQELTATLCCQKERKLTPPHATRRPPQNWGANESSLRALSGPPGSAEPPPFQRVLTSAPSSASVPHRPPPHPAHAAPHPLAADARPGHLAAYNVCISGSPDRTSRCLGALDLHVRVRYQPGSRYWTFQWLESALFLAAGLALAGLGLWRIRRHN